MKADLDKPDGRIVSDQTVHDAFYQILSKLCQEILLSTNSLEGRIISIMVIMILLVGDWSVYMSNKGFFFSI